MKIYTIVKKIPLFFYTIKYLKFVQLFYQLRYFFEDRFYKRSFSITKSHKSIVGNSLILKVVIKNDSFLGYNNFVFLNVSHKFGSKIDWELKTYGKLWQYNLSYFDFLNSSKLDSNLGKEMIIDFIDSIKFLKSSMEPYPISIRVINWIKFVSKYKINDVKINNAIYNQVIYLTSKLEYHILGNHLLENAFCLLHASYYLNNNDLLVKAKKILVEQLKEQILNDGAHFELSPMYHQIVLFRILEGLDLIINNRNFTTDTQLMSLFENTAKNMLGWLNRITFSNGDIPMVNDSSKGIAPTTMELVSIAETLFITPREIVLNESGYRKRNGTSYESLLDIGQIGPKYQPGHGHSDMLNLIVYIKGLPILVDTGTSTYQIGTRRYLERSTSSHNTVTINDHNQSQVWSGFRVAKRASINIIQDSKDTIIANVLGFNSTEHKRCVKFSSDEIIVLDMIKGKTKANCGIVHWHFHPNVKVEVIEGKVITQLCEIEFENHKDVFLEDYFFSNGFNDLKRSKKIKVKFNHRLSTKIKIS